MAKILKIKSIKFKAGSAPGQPPLTISCPNVTVLIGPNNSGKSRTLREIEAACTGDEIQVPSAVIDALEIELPNTGEEIREMLAPYDRGDPPGNNPPNMGYFWLTKPQVGALGGLQIQTPLHGFDEWLENSSLQQLKIYFVRFLMSRLDGTARFSLVEHQASGPLEKQPTNHIWTLFVDDKARQKVSNFTEAAFRRFFTVDPTGMTLFRMRLSERPPEDTLEEQALDSRAREFHAAAPMVVDLGDGVKASIGLVTAVHALPDRILLVDEPEAFLHPTLARRIGGVLATTARERDASLIVATHSAEFLVGCVQAAPELRLVRLTYETSQATARTLDPKDITPLMNDPLLRSANALRGLFHRGVVVCEADADRAFYEEVNARLVADGRGTEDTLFMNAQNWQTIPRIAEPLRKLGVPAAGIFDFDVLMDKDFGHLWPLVNADVPELSALKLDRAKVKTLMDAKGRKQVKEQGLTAFSGADLVLLKGVVAKFAEHGVLFVPNGELENWQKHVGIPTGNKARWILKMFEHMGSDPQAAGFVKAGTGDVWKFMEDVKGWIENPARRGIPT